MFLDESCIDRENQIVPLFQYVYTMVEVEESESAGETEQGKNRGSEEERQNEIRPSMEISSEQSLNVEGTEGAGCIYWRLRSKEVGMIGITPPSQCG